MSISRINITMFSDGNLRNISSFPLSKIDEHQDFSFEDFPLDVFCHIAFYLDKKDLFSLMLVSKFAQENFKNTPAFVKIIKKEVNAEFLKEKEVDSVLNFLKRHSFWERIVITSCHLNVDHLQLLNHIIGNSRYLKYLDLSFNDLKRADLELLQTEISRAPNLETLNLTSNDICPFSPRAIRDFKMYYYSKDEDVGFANVTIGSRKGYNFSGKAVFSSKEINFDNVDLTINNIFKAALAPSANLKWLINIIKQSTSLKSIDLSNNDLNLNDLNLLIKALKNSPNSKLEEVFIESVYIKSSQTECKAILNKMNEVLQANQLRNKNKTPKHK